LSFHDWGARWVFVDHASLDERSGGSSGSRISGLIVLAIVALCVGGFIGFRILSKPVSPAPREVARDPLLSQGRLIYLARCVACHGNDGRGDGPLAGQLIGPPAGDLTDQVWKHGDRPAQVVGVIGGGVPNTRMEGWSRVLDPPELNAVAAYVYYLAGRAVPEEIRRQ
jgi:mono/diheme cytochrome c family protein